MKISREKAKEICTKSQYGEATWWEILQLKVYLFFSKELAQFSAKNTKLTSLCEHANLQTLSEKDKEQLKKVLEENS
ncbi:hypothetical protein L0P88_14490 [Muricauda sp. SCSIO 64092]|uniref:hypothetical protein n=1 Tax=Allomuricauda sp. SCSIO 64092 TaxID=2908842 RepID=UPI00131E5D4D|nr:hypothetical protein [Muricauda sp. SCSIO 64092]UOY05151.1 hypothetical protein L0P88_14490 [Muricauda sp. SCSIO 64092]